MRRLGFLAAGLALMVAGCATSAPHTQAPKQPGAVDLTGKWSGIWMGYGINTIPREVTASADLTQRGSQGYGRLILDGTAASESIPLDIRETGLGGSRVFFDVSGYDMTMVHELGARVFQVDFKVDGDRMIGYVRDVDPPVRIVLEREKPQSLAQAPVAPPAPATPPPPPAPPVAAAPPVPQPAPEPAAMAPPPAE